MKGKTLISKASSSTSFLFISSKFLEPCAYHIGKCLLHKTGDGIFLPKDS